MGQIIFMHETTSVVRCSSATFSVSTEGSCVTAEGVPATVLASLHIELLL